MKNNHKTTVLLHPSVLTAFAIGLRAKILALLSIKAFINEPIILRDYMKTVCNNCLHENYNQTDFEIIKYCPRHLSYLPFSEVIVTVEKLESL